MAKLSREHLAVLSAVRGMGVAVEVTGDEAPEMGRLAMPTVAQKSHAVSVALSNLQGGESMVMAEHYVMMGFPTFEPELVHRLVQLAGQIIDADPEYVRS